MAITVPHSLLKLAVPGPVGLERLARLFRTAPAASPDAYDTGESDLRPGPEDAEAGERSARERAFKMSLLRGI